MNPVEFYVTLLASIQEEDIQRVARIMLDHIGEERAINLPDLVRQSFGEYNTSTERKTRLVLEDLVTKYRLPIGAISGKAGRWLCANAEEVSRVVSDLESRRDATNNRIHSLRTAHIPAAPAQQPVKSKLWS